MPRDPREAGALWIKTSKKGQEFMSGTINGQEVVCFRNDRKTGNQPDWRVMKSEPKPDHSGVTRQRDEQPEAERTYDESDF